MERQIKTKKLVVGKFGSGSGFGGMGYRNGKELGLVGLGDVGLQREVRLSLSRSH